MNIYFGLYNIFVVEEEGKKPPKASIRGKISKVSILAVLLD